MINNRAFIKLLTLILVISMVLSMLTACPVPNPGTSSSSHPTTGTWYNTTTSTTTSTSTSTTTSITTTTKGPDDWKDYPSDHSDINNDGLCDDCDADVVETLDFYNFNDLHGKFDDTSEQPGVDELTTYLENRKNIDEHVIILSTGDMWQGSAESNVTKGALVTEWMNYLGFEAMTLGNHEYDWGADFIRNNAELAEFPFLAINIFDNATGKRVDYCDASVVIERGGVQIGIIGAIGDCYSSILGEMTKGISFKTGDALTALVRAESEKLRAEGADIIVYLIHDGENYKNAGNTSKYYDQTLSRDGYIDLVFEGHSHSYYIFTDNYGVPHLQGGGDNGYGITHVEVNVNFANGEIDFSATDYIKHSACSNLPDAPIVDELLEKYKDEISVVFRELGYNKRYRSSKDISRLVAQLYYNAGVEKWGDEYDIVLAGGSINLRSPYNVQAGTVKYSDLEMILPFENKIMLCSIKGSDLLEKFYNNSDYYIYYSLSASQIDPNKTYYIIADSWTSSYAWAKCTEIATYDNETFARDLLAKYIENGGWNN